MNKLTHRSYEDLVVWQKSVELSKNVYKISKTFPKEEIYSITNQIRRSAVSISANIAEGCGRNNYGEFIQFLGIAGGSLAELHTHIIIAHDAEYLSKQNFDILLKQIIEIRKMIAGLKSSLKDNYKNS